MDTQKIQTIENLGVGLDNKILTLLVLLEAKPATTIDILPNIYTPKNSHTKSPTYEIDTALVQSLENQLTNIGMSVAFSEKKYIPHKNSTKNKMSKPIFYEEKLPIHIAKDPTIARKLMIASEGVWKSGKKMYHAMCGQLYGFPQTAIDAFCGKRKKYEEVFKEDDIHLTFSPLWLFTQFAFSADNYKEELQLSQKWHDCIQKNSPRLYQELLDSLPK